MTLGDLGCYTKQKQKPVGSIVSMKQAKKANYFVVPNTDILTVTFAMGNTDTECRVTLNKG